MTECKSYETHKIYPSLNAIPLNKQQQFRLNKIKEIKDAKIKESELMSKRLSKCIASFD